MQRIVPTLRQPRVAALAPRCTRRPASPCTTPSRIRCGPRRGVALLISLIALLLLALLSAGMMHLARGDFSRTRDEGVMRRAANAADAGAYDVIRRWPANARQSSPIGAVFGPDTLQLTGSTAITRTMRTSRSTVWSVSVGSAGDSLAHTLSRRIVQVALRLAIPEPAVNAALVVRDSLAVTGSARIVGTDTALAGWGASCALAAPTAAVAMPDTTRLCDGTCGTGSTTGRIAGLPPLLADSAAADTARYRSFGAESWRTLAGHATVVLAAGSVVTPSPSLLSGVCDRLRPDNWGSPGGTGPCATYAPLIWARGDLEIRGGVGQGVLLVDGDLTLSAGAQFAGVVIARDDLLTQGPGGTIFGVVLAEDARVAPGDHTTLGGFSRVQRSHCAVDQAVEWSARLVPVRRRAWAALR